MKNLHKSAWAEVRTEALRNNLAVIRSKLPAGTAVCAVLKADAYGHGMKGMYRFLSANRLADMAAVGKMKELMTLTALSESGGLPLLLLGPTESDELETCLREGTVKPDRTVFSVYSMRQFDELEALAEKLSLWLTVHIRVDGWDSGMGLSYEEFLRNEDRLLSARGLHVRGLYSHLYTSYSEDLEGIRGELERFDAFLCRIRPEHRAQLTVHILNSALVFLFPQYAYDMVRTGTAMYGLPSFDGGRLRPILRICAHVFDVREISDEAPLCYESHMDKPHDGCRRIARIMLGYWDSPLLLTQKEIRILIRGRLFPLADDICMDNLAVDVTGAEDIAIGDEAVLLGEGGVSLAETMERTGISVARSEWLCMTAGRLEKVIL